MLWADEVVRGRAEVRVMMDLEVKIREYAASRGWSGKLTPSQYREAALAVRPARRKIVDAATAIESRVTTSLGFRTVPLHIIDRNRATCEACPDGKFDRLKGGEPVCLACQCSDKYLEAKWRDRRQKCKRGHWDNTKLTEDDFNGAPEPARQA